MTKGGKIGGCVDVEEWSGSTGGGEKEADEVSRSRIAVREWVVSQGGGRIWARRWRFRRRASQRGSGVRWGGERGGRGP